MIWYYKQLGGHTHVRVFVNGGKCGDLVFRNEEFAVIVGSHKLGHHNLITFRPELVEVASTREL